MSEAVSSAILCNRWNSRQIADVQSHVQQGLDLDRRTFGNIEKVSEILVAFSRKPFSNVTHGGDGSPAELILQSEVPFQRTFPAIL